MCDNLLEFNGEKFNPFGVSHFRVLNKGRRVPYTFHSVTFDHPLAKRLFEKKIQNRPLIKLLYTVFSHKTVRPWQSAELAMYLVGNNDWRVKTFSSNAEMYAYRATKIKEHSQLLEK